jgi:hypothetical protein
MKYDTKKYVLQKGKFVHGDIVSFLKSFWLHVFHENKMKKDIHERTVQ